MNADWSYFLSGSKTVLKLSYHYYYHDFFEVTSSFSFEALQSKLVLMYVNTDVVYRGYSKDNVKQTLYLTSGDFTGSVDSIEAVQ